MAGWVDCQLGMQPVASLRTEYEGELEEERLEGQGLERLCLERQRLERRLAARGR